MGKCVPQKVSWFAVTWCQRLKKLRLSAVQMSYSNVLNQIHSYYMPSIPLAIILGISLPKAPPQTREPYTLHQEGESNQQ